MSALPSRGDIAGTPTNGTAKSGFGSLFDFIAQRLAAGTSGAGTATAAELQTSRESLGILIPRGHIAGLTLSTAGSSSTFSVAAGQAADSANAVLMELAASLSKTTSSWAVGTGNGALDTGTIANNTWYHAWLIRRPDTGVVDALASTSASSPTMPANYTQKRRIGSLRTNGSAQWVLFVQTEDYFEWDAAVMDVSVSNPGTSAVTRTLTVPTGVVVEAHFNGGAYNGSSTVTGCLFSALSKSDQTPSETTTPLWNSGALNASTGSASRSSYVTHRIYTNTSAQVRSRLAASDASINLYVATLGWRDTRGRFQ